MEDAMEEEREPKRQKLRSAAEPDSAPAAADPSRVWLPELVERFAASLPPNEAGGTFRLVAKAAAAAQRPTTIHLSQPVPLHAFAWRMARPGATRRLTRGQRQELPHLLARSGSVAHLEVLLEQDDLATDPLRPSVFLTAAAAGQLEVCRWLHQQGCDWRGAEALAAAAEGGHGLLCAWLVGEGAPHGEAAGAAARGGHLSLMLRLLSLGGANPSSLVNGAAVGCSLGTMRTLLRTALPAPEHEWDCEQWELYYGLKASLVDSAAAGRTEDWQAKVEWLEARDFDQGWRACELPVSSPDAPARLQWLLNRGYTIDPSLGGPAAQAGNAAALQFVMNCSQFGWLDASDATMRAAEGGHVSVLEVLHAEGFRARERALTSAAGGGHLPAVAWLVDKLGAESALTAAVFRSAACSGSMQLLAWLEERDCPWDAATFVGAAECGSEEQLEWLVEQGCPMGADGAPYVRAALRGDVPVLECLRRLGCPWSSYGCTVTRLLEDTSWVSSGRPEALLLGLQWLLAHGCPVDWGAAGVVVEAVAARAAEGGNVSGGGRFAAGVRQLAVGLGWVAAAAREGLEVGAVGEVVGGDAMPSGPWCWNREEELVDMQEDVWAA